MRVPPSSGSPSTPFPASRPTNVRWQIFGLSCATSWTLYLHRYTFGIVTPKLAEEWDVSLTDLGFMQSAFYGAYVAVQVPCGMLVDRLGTHLFLAGIVMAWSGILALQAWAPGPAAMFPVRLLFGVAQAGCYPALGKVTQAWFPLAIRTSLQAWIASFFGRFGGASANLLFGAFMIGMLGLDWRSGLLILAAWGAVLGVAILVVFRNTPREHPRVNQAEVQVIAGRHLQDPSANDVSGQTHSTVAADDPSAAPGGPDAARGDASAYGPSWREGVVTRRSVANLLFFFLQWFGATFADTIYVAWLPTVLKEEHQVTDAEMGFYSSLPLLGGAAGGLMGGYVNDWMIRRIGRRWARSLVGCCGNAAAAGLVLVAMALFRDPLLLCGLLFGAKIFSDWSQPTTWGAVTDIAGRYAGTIFGLGNGLGGLGAVIASPLLGHIAESYDSWHLVFFIIAATYAASSVCWLAVNCTIPVLRPAERVISNGGIR